MMHLGLKRGLGEDRMHDSSMGGILFPEYGVKKA